MTILENDVIPMRNKLSLTKTKYKTSDQLKRKYAFEEDSIPAKKQAFNEMLNGYRGEQRSNGDSSQDPPVATLSNMGNTCYLNSVLYTLRFAPTFLHNLHHLIGDLSLVSSKLNQTKAKTSSLGRNIGSITGPSSRSTSSKDLLSLGSSCDIIPKSKVQVVTEKLHELFMTMHTLEMKESNDPYQPVALLQAVREANSIFEGNNQQDAHELLVYLLDNIRETCDVLTQQVQQNPELLTETEALPTVNSSKIWNVRNSWKKSLKKKDKSTKESITEEQVNGSHITDAEDATSVDGSNSSTKRKLCYNFVAEDFEGITLRRTKCLECEGVTERKEPFYDIPVPISLKDEDAEDVNVSDIFRRACVTTEKLCDSNKYLCENCERYNEASREVLFEKLPNIMVLQLKRFTTSTMGVQKVNTYLPTPLALECFCESCCKVEENQSRIHRYKLCCVIMHLGGTMASGHYIAYVKATDHLEDYTDCTRDLPKGSLSASSSEKSLNILKFLKPRSLGGSLIDSRNGLTSRSVNSIRTCKSMDCCGVKINKNVVENVINSFSRKIVHDYKWHPNNNCASSPSSEDMWLECDDENVRALTTQEFIEELAHKPNSTSTPYLLFYAKITDQHTE
ncbi:ubiquitin carboxyl-terminal hydrolase 1 [Diorhabda carinulata]|uniref:ubiquitin carboxyl-terminal hydrolase 1 n=1 Tax=Diorhabda sublineata TaxID=1163346 RepID=UPI0024E0D845|nr:ubiquitin carboxyl-terminal hydrolase 1 [Diorhabda sublineata]XP_057658846.1 ubiquitin carboxyl-terminal hydrolase 1 [Diorhabda carinulata]